MCVYVYIYTYICIQSLVFSCRFCCGQGILQGFSKRTLFWSWAQILASLNNKVSVREGPRRAGFDSTVCGCPLRFYVWVILTEDRAPHSN